MTKGRIMIVEDEGITALTIQKKLETLGYQVPLIVSSGEEAVQQVEPTAPDLILMDIKLAGEMDDAGLRQEAILAVEGPAWMLQDFEDQWADAGRRRRLVEAVRRVESEPALLGASAHLLGIGVAG